jgi:hypothetical protein
MKVTPTLLVVLATLVILSSIALVQDKRRVAGLPTPAPPIAPPSSTTVLTRDVALIDFLPPGFVTDGSVDYSQAVREAFLAAANGTLTLPNFPIRVSRANNQAWCVLVEAPMLVTGSASSALVESQGGVQLLRVRNVDGFTLRDVTLRGCPIQGQGLAHGLVQVVGGRSIHIEGVRVDGCDADGIAVAQSEGVVIDGCTVSRASKSAIYVNASTRVRVHANEVIAFGGQRTNSGVVVGAGIQLSSNRDVVCSENIVQGGTGVGILVNALEAGVAPVGTIVTANRVTNTTNPANSNVSSGIRLANGSGDGRTQTIVSGNSLRGCGAFGIYVENHHGALISENSIVESQQSGIMIASVQDAIVIDNVVLNSGTSGLTNYHQVHLINQATGVVVRNNELRDLASYEPGAAKDSVLDASQGTNNLVEPTLTFGRGPNFTGVARRGDVVLARAPGAGDYIGWVCVSSGEPGVWKPFGRIEH